LFWKWISHIKRIIFKLKKENLIEKLPYFIKRGNWGKKQ
jgi:hypothetical protein